MGTAKIDWSTIQFRFDEEGQLRIKGPADANLQKLLCSAKAREIGGDEWVVMSLRTFHKPWPDQDCRCDCG